MYGLSFKSHNPKGEFNQNVDRPANGISLNGLFKLGGSNFWLGGEFGVAMYSNDSYNYELPNGRTIRLDEEDCFWTLHADTRYMVYSTPLIKTYLSGRVGMTNFFSTVGPARERDSRHFDYKSKTHGTAFNAGLGAGLMLNFGQLFTKTPGNVSMDVGFAINSGTKSSYRYMPETQNTVQLSEGEYRSLTNYTELRIGLLCTPDWD
jgi:hypothetical protein